MRSYHLLTVSSNYHSLTIMCTLESLGLLRNLSAICMKCKHNAFEVNTKPTWTTTSSFDCSKTPSLKISALGMTCGQTQHEIRPL